jgi:segregation and condensation protein B
VVARLLELTALVESLLFVADEPVSVGRLAEALEVAPGQVERALRELEQSLEGRGLRVERMGSRVQLVTAAEAAEHVQRFLGLAAQRRLSPAALEALAIIAYRQPTTRPAIEAVRGVSSDAVLRTLLSAGLIEEVGRAPTVGRPILYGTTFGFLQHFGLGRLEDMPPLEGNSNELQQAGNVLQGGGVDSQREEGG